MVREISRISKSGNGFNDKILFSSQGNIVIIVIGIPTGHDMTPARKPFKSVVYIII